MKQLKLYVLLMIILLGVTSHAQDVSNSASVYVTTQDYAVLRAGPGTIWDRLTVISYGETFQAVGRTIDADWIQIAYTGALDDDARTEFTQNGVTYGWIASWLLIWTGNILELPIDGITPVATTRAAGALITIGPDSYVYEDEVDPSRRIESPAQTPVRVEVTGRLGEVGAGYYWIQFKMNGKYYWTASWDTGSSYRFRDVPDASYLYPYSRLQTLLQRKSVEARITLNDIRGRWQNLDRGQPVTCNNIPNDLTIVGFTQSDLNLEPLYAPAALAFDDIRLYLNRALAAFREICAQSPRVASTEVIQTALEDLRNAERFLNILEDWVIPFQRRDPLLGQRQETTP